MDFIIIYIIILVFHSLSYLCIIDVEHSNMHHLHYIRLKCIMSCMEDANNGFLAIIHSWFMDLDNPYKGVVHNLLIEGITCLGHWVEAPIVCALPCMVTLLETLDYLFVTPPN